MPIFPFPPELKHRKIKIINFDLVGDYIFFYFLLNDFVNYKGYKLTHYSSTFRSLFDGKDKNLLVMRSDLPDELAFVSSSDEKAEIDNWLEMVNNFTLQPDVLVKNYDNTVFLKFLSIQPVSNSSISPKLISNKFQLVNRIRVWILMQFSKRNLFRKKYFKLLSNYLSTDNWGYILKISKKYTIKILQYFQTNCCSSYRFTNALLHFSLPVKYFFKANEIKEVIGSQDIFYFHLESNLYGPVLTTLEIRQKDGTNPKFIHQESSRKIEIPSLRISLKLTHTLFTFFLKYLFPIMIFIFGSLLVTISTSANLGLPFMQQFYGDYPWLKIGELVLGLFFQALGLFVARGGN